MTCNVVAKMQKKKKVVHFCSDRSNDNVLLTSIWTIAHSNAEICSCSSKNPFSELSKSVVKQMENMPTPTKPNPKEELKKKQEKAKKKDEKAKKKEEKDEL